MKVFGWCFLIGAFAFFVAGLGGYHAANLYLAALACGVIGGLALVRARERHIAVRLAAVADAPDDSRAVSAISTPPPEPEPAKETSVDAVQEQDPEPRPKERMVSGGVILPPPPDGSREERRLRLVHTDGKRLELRNRPASWRKK